MTFGLVLDLEDYYSISGSTRRPICEKYRLVTQQKIIKASLLHTFQTGGGSAQIRIPVKTQFN